MAIMRSLEVDLSSDVESSADTSSLVTLVPTPDNRERLRILEALLFASSEPLSVRQLATQLGEGQREEISALLTELAAIYENRGVNLVQAGGCWAFRTAPDLGYLLQKHAIEQRRLSRAALETLAIIAYHQPVTRADIEEIRGVTTSKGTLDVLLETGWVRLRGRRRAPGRPVTYGTAQAFLDHFGLDSVKDLPGLAELKGNGLLDSNLPPDFEIPEPIALETLADNEEPLADESEDPSERDFVEENEDDETREDEGKEAKVGEAG